MEETTILRVEFPERGIFAFDPNGLDLRIGDYCITEDTDSNVDLGQVVGRLKTQKRKFQRPMRKVLREATEEDRERFEKNARKEIEAREICRRKAEHAVDNEDKQKCRHTC